MESQERKTRILSHEKTHANGYCNRDKQSYKMTIGIHVVWQKAERPSSPAARERQVAAGWGLAMETLKQKAAWAVGVQRFVRCF
jgi:hypothetical protein